MSSIQRGSLSILARPEPIAEDEWFVLLEDRRSALAEHLRDMTLRTLGELRFISDFFGDHTLVKDRDTIEFTGDKRFNLDTRGVFPSDENGAEFAKTEWHPRPGTEACPGDEPTHNSTKRFWGLTRDGAWISVEVLVTRDNEPYKHPGRYEQVARARRVQIIERQPKELCSIVGRTPQAIWECLGEAARKWLTHRRYLLQNIEGLVEAIEFEEKLQKLVPKA